MVFDLGTLLLAKQEDTGFVCLLPGAKSHWPSAPDAKADDTKIPNPKSKVPWRFRFRLAGVSHALGAEALMAFSSRERVVLEQCLGIRSHSKIGLPKVQDLTPEPELMSAAPILASGH